MAPGSLPVNASLARRVALEDLEDVLPAEEVGGDFYEFRPISEGGAWIGVGDVTGHGVTSGLIMMMAQSMFTMLCEQSNGHVSPAKFVSLLNRALFYNLRSRLEQDRFMTLVVAKIDHEGRMVYAGAHTDLLIYRAAHKSVGSPDFVRAAMQPSHASASGNVSSTRAACFSFSTSSLGNFSSAITARVHTISRT